MRHRLAFLFLSLLVACSKSESSAASTLPESYWLASPAHAKSVKEAVAAKDGEDVVVTGRVGGSPRPFVDGVAAFGIVDASLVPCGEDGMSCETPWDYCCADPKALAAGSVNVEIVDGARPLAATVRGFHGLDPLDTVVVAGKVRKDAQGNVTILARGIHVR